MAQITGLVIYDSVLFQRGRMINRWASTLARNFERNAQAAAPYNKRAHKSSGEPPPGSLGRSIRGDADKVGPKIWQVIVSVNVHYAMYVIGGTGPLITSPSGGDMVLPLNPGRGGRRRHAVVRGQAPNNFMVTAHRMTALQHSSIRGQEHLLFQQW